jgi:hypothetical protein
MIITGKQFRYFYPQKSLNFNFKVSNYSSNNFEIGITGTNYIYFKFKDGIIKDHYENIVGTFNKDSIDIEAYIKDDKYEYYLNSIPVARDLIIANATSVFSSLVVQILDTPVTNSVEISASVNGEKIPELEFSNFYSTEVTSVNLSNYNEYPVDIFSFSSSTITGEWLYPSILYPNQSSNFLNYDTIDIDVNTPVTLNLDTNFGQRSYTLYVQEIGSNIDPTEPRSDDREFNSIITASISKYSGSIVPTGVSKAVYKIDYNLSEPAYNLDLSFDYLQGKSGDATINLTKAVDVTFSGTLSAREGKSSGILYNSNFSLIEKDYKLGASTQDITLYPELTLTGYFKDLEPTGIVSIVIEDIVPLTKNLNDNQFTQENSYYMDLGGKTGLYGNGKPDTIKEYQRLVYYKDVRIDNNVEYISISGEVKKGDEGKYTFSTVTVPITSGILFNSQDYSNNLTADQVDVTIYPYRGVGFASLQNQFAILSGDKDGSRRPFLIMNESTDAVFFKNIPNIDYNGQYIIYPTKTQENLVKGRVLSIRPRESRSDIFYYKTGLYFNINDELVADSFINNSIIKDGINVYRNLSAFENVEDTKSQLYIKYDQEDRKVLGPEIDWNDNNFLALSNQDQNDIPVFYSTSENLTLGFIIKDSLFLKDNLIISKSINLINITTNGIEAGSALSSEDLNTEYSLDGAKLKFKKYETPNNNIDAIYDFSHNFTLNEDGDYQISFYVNPSLLEEGQSNYLIRMCLSYGNQTFYSFLNVIGTTVGEILGGGAIPIKQGDSNIHRLIFPFKELKAKNYNLKFSFIKYLDFQDSNKLTEMTNCEGVNFNPEGKIAYFEITGIQVEKKDCDIYDTTNCKPSSYSDFAIDNSTQYRSFWKSSVFSFFIHSLYGLKGDFTSIHNFFKPFDLDLRDSRIKSCSNGCFIIDNKTYQTVKYEEIINYGGKSINYNNTLQSNPNIYNFFIIEILPFLSIPKNNIFIGNIQNDNYPILFTDFNKLYLKGVDQAGKNVLKTFERNDANYGESIQDSAIIEIINLLLKYNSFTYERKQVKNKFYYVPISIDGTNTPVEESNLSDIIFSGHLQNNMSLNIQAGYCRYYPYNNSTNSRKNELFGYFYETENFFDVKNGQLVDSIADSLNTNINNNIFPDEKEEINKRPSSTLSLNTEKAKLKRLIKKDSVLDFIGTVDRTVYVDKSFFSQVRNVSVDLIGTFYNAQKNMSAVWDIRIFDNPNLVGQPSFSNSITNPTIVTYEAKGIVPQGKKDGEERSLYLEVSYEHKDDFKIIESDQALISLILKESSSDTSPEIETLTIL